MKAIDSTISDSEKNMITPNSVIESLIRHVKDQIVIEENKDQYLELLQKIIREEYLKILENEIAKAFITAYEEQAQSLFDTYLDNAECYTNRTTVKDKITKEERLPDEKYMKIIEECIGVTGSSTDGFRSDVTAYMFAKMRRGEKINYKSYGPLKDAIESFLIFSVKDMSRIVTKSKSRDDDQKKRYSEMMETLITEYGYNEDSAEEVLTFASNNLWRDS
jgi:serine protein kinase